ncbi:DNA helicase [Azoarcus olearius]|uniref:exodeoxyribonuclease V subunit gamma n=1 Tax=Azoarcus sp. (strain BH72) TaxID=418699 RepID=UPI0008061D84|nr:exodeoxyribonuclease V subunit gamma [Azoarcus olearius]ANQ87018.1 DNA helicase [Azoarcus olearius]
MFSIVFSNRYECLQAMLLERLAAERPGPFGKRHVVVPSSALRRDVELAVAEHEGVCANVEFSYLAQWLWTQIGHVVEVPARSPFAPALLAWRVHALLDPAAPAGDWVAAHPRLAHYLAGADARMRFELAERIARVFDHYLTYRPHWLESWARGERARLGEATEAERADEAWQAALWRHIRDGLALRQEHPAALFLRRVAGMDERALAAAGLPQTVHVFGLPALPPLYLAILRELARVVDVRLYALNPCREFWFEIVDPRRLSWLAARQADMFHETGNRLLAAWGQQTQAHIGLLFEGEREVVEEALFEPHPGRHLLARLHNAILDMEELEPGSVALAANDRSIELHVCHSRTRELEVLHDRLLDLMKAAAKRGEPLRPDEIVVLTPDLDATAPLIEAVFGTAPAARRIPWRITGLGGTQENPVAAALDRLLALVAGRLPASAVFDLLQQPVVAARFGLGEGDLETIHDWMRAAGIRWGLDAEHAAAAGGVPVQACGGHTLDAGLDRLFLGWAAGDAATAAPFAGFIGAGAAEGNAALALGRLWRYVDTLRALRADLQRPQQAAGWRRALDSALTRLVGDEPEWAEALREVREAIVALTQAMAAAATDDGDAPAIPLAVVHPALIAQLDDPARGGVPGGTVTFSALSSLRGLPYRVVCVVGLDQGLFPGSDRPAEFDLMAARPERGDRQRRHDDRNLFLDVLLSAREVLHLSHVGRSVRDGSALPPSVLVDELFDVLAAACAADPGKPDDLAAARRRLTVEHPLQAFSAEYFLPQGERDPRLVSYHEEYAAALAARLGAPLRDADDDALVALAEEGDEVAVDGARVPFFDAPLPPPGPEWREVGLPQLIRFFRNPSRYLLRDRLGLALPEGEAELEDVEPMVPDFLGRQALAERLLPALLGATVPDEEALLALARAGGEYPAGALGEGALRRELAQLAVFAAGVRAELPARPLPPHVPTLAFDLDGEPWTLGAAFGDLRPQGLLRQRYDDCRPVDYLAAWLAHLVLCAAPAPDVACETTLLARDGRCRFVAVPPATAHALLADCLRLYRDGLLRPLHFFPKAAWAYAVNGESMGKAYARWQGGNRPAFAESADPAYRLALRGVADPLADDFAALASRVLGPLLDHLDDPRLDLAPAQESA